MTVQQSPTAVQRVKVEPGIYKRGNIYEIMYRPHGARNSTRRKVDGNLADARRALRAAIKGRDDREPVATDTRRTFGAAADAWLENLIRPYKRPATVVCYEAAVKHLKREFGHRRLTEITPDDVARYYRKQAGKLSGNTLKTHRAAMSGTYNYAARNGQFTGEWPGKRLTGDEQPNGDGARKPRALTAEEITALLASARDRERLMYRLALATGMRMSEVLGLRWGDLDLGESPAAVFDTQLSRGRERGQAPLKNSRSQPSRRAIIVDPSVARDLTFRRLTMDSHNGDTDYVFSHNGQPLDQRNVGRAFTGAVKRAKLDAAVTFHWLRHTHGSQLFAAGTPIADVALQLGDKVATVMSTYLHAIEDDGREDRLRQRMAALLAADTGQPVAMPLAATAADPQS